MTRSELVLPAGAIAFAESLESFLRNHPRTAELVDDALDGRSVRLRVLPTLAPFPVVADPLPIPALPPAQTPAPASPPLAPAPDPPASTLVVPEHPPITVLASASSTVPVPSLAPALPVPTELAAETALEAAAQAEIDARFSAQVDAKLAEQREMAAEMAARASGSRRSAPPRALSTDVMPTGTFAGVEIVSPSRRPSQPAAPEPEYVEFELAVSRSSVFIVSPLLILPP